MANVLVAGSALLSAGKYISAVLNVKKGLDECRLLELIHRLCAQLTAGLRAVHGRHQHAGAVRVE